MTNTEAAAAVTETKEEAYELLKELGELPTLTEILEEDKEIWGS